MVTTQTYYLTAIFALALSGVSLAIGLANLIIAQRNRLVDASEKMDSRAAEQAYKYSKEVQNVLIEVERYKRQQCGGSEQLYYTRLKELHYEEDWEIKEKMTIANGFWRETIFLWNKGKLPDEFFEKQNIWLNRGNMYRLLLEPADIANHYGFKSFADSGHYLDGNRAGRYIFLEDLWARRKSTKPISSIDFALHEQKASVEGYQQHRNDLPLQQKITSKLQQSAAVATHQQALDAAKLKNNV